MSIARPTFMRTWWFMPVLLSIFYFLTHLLALTALPIFADEAIYIHWAKLIQGDWQRYLFFPLNDGKTPLFIWVLWPFETLFHDPLWAGRLAGVLIGFGQMWLNGYLVKVLGGRLKTQWLAMLLTAILPFWFFYHRQALIDSLLVLCLTAVMIATIKILRAGQLQTELSLKQVILKNWLWIAILGVSFWASLMTKLPAVLILPVLGVWWLGFKLTKSQRVATGVQLALGLALSAILFSFLALVPGVGQIFHRGSDFLWPWRAVVFEGHWRDTLPAIPSYFGYFMSYTHPFVLVGLVASLFVRKRKRLFHLLFWSAIVFGLPMALLGKVVYPRYFLPLMIWMTASAALIVEQIYRDLILPAKLNWRMIFSVIVALALANIFAASGAFMYQAWYQPDQLSLVPLDKIQYLTEWSSGHGLRETTQFIKQLAQTEKVAVATEGYFGTLPDGLSIYFNAQTDPNVTIDGIGQPVGGIPDWFRQSARGSTKQLLVVNSDRLKMTLPPEALINQYCRPYQASCLQVWDITDYLKTTPLQLIKN